MDHLIFNKKLKVHLYCMTESQFQTIFKQAFHKLLQLYKIFMICSQKRLLELLQQPKKTNAEREQIVKLIINGGYDLPDCLFENAYLVHTHDPNSDQKYTQLQSIINTGMEMNMPLGFVRKFLKEFRKKIGDNPYIMRMRKFITYLGSSDFADEMSFIHLARDDLTNTQTVKKIISIDKRKNKMGEFMANMNDYLEKEPLDEEAWCEMGEIYCEKSNFLKASFCYEELVVLNPNNDIFTLRLAELYITQNTKNSTDKAIKYLSYLISKRPDNLRALWILHRACSGMKGQEYVELGQACKEAICKLYSKKSPSLKLHLALNDKN